MGVQGLTTWVEISKEALRHNVRFFKALLGNTKVFIVVKSNAYGHGTEAVLSAVGSMREVAGIMVASLDEALAVPRRHHIPLFVLSIWQQDEKKILAALRRQIVFPIYDLSQAQYLDRFAKRVKKKIRVQVKIDVGTMRLGFRWDDMTSLRKAVLFRNLNYVGVFSHFADSENKDESFTTLQHARFKAVVEALRNESGHRDLIAHIACSASAMRNRRYHHDGVRIGISLYGLWPSQDMYALTGRRIILQPTLCWKTRITQLKELKAGETVGYGLSYRADRPTRLAVLPIGYWDGYDRRFSNQASVLIGGTRCSVRGRVCMNLTMVEVPPGVAASVGDEVVLLGDQGARHISAEELARLAGTINYEIVTRINPSIPRITT